MNFQVQNRTIENWERMKMKKCDSRVKTRKGSLKQKRNSQRLVGGANRRMKGQRPDNIRSLYEVLYLFQDQKFELLVPECPPPNSRVYHGGSWRLPNCHIQEQQKWIFLRYLIFKEFIFPKKKTLETCHLFAQLNCENKSFEPDHQILSQCPFGDF